MQRRRYTQWAGHFPPGQGDFSARDELEMFDRIGDVDFVAIDADFFQRPVEHLPGRSDEWLAGKVLLVAGLLADQHHLGSLRTFAELRLGGVFPEMTGAAMRGLLAQGFEAGWRGRHGLVFRIPFENIVRR